MEHSDTRRRLASSTETAWCRAVPGGTGIAILALSSTEPPSLQRLENALHKLQNSHPVLKSKLHFNHISSTFSFLTSPTPFVQLKIFGIPETSKILLNDQNALKGNISISPFQILLERELNDNTAWRSLNSSGSDAAADILFVNLYEVGIGKWVAIFRLHVAACDRTTAVSLLEELLVLMTNDGRGGGEKKGEVERGLEELVPRNLMKKPLLARGLNMLSHSVNSLRLTNLKFKDVKSARRSQLARFQINQTETNKILSECKLRGIKLSSVLVAAGLMAAHSSGSHGFDRHHRKYGIITLVDCRRFLEPPLTSHHFGFYHAAIFNSYTIKGGEDLWELAEKVSTTVEASKNSNKHFTDMSDLNFLMCRVIENPSLTASGAMRTSLMTIFEDTVFDNSGGMQKDIGINDYVGCASIHGIGPSAAMFDTVRNGRLDCACIYPSPLHSRDQMEALLTNIKTLLVKG
ncbi:uncharacterized protein E5676_scaffold352G003990 [Cucumis melo var. makuwa]|uniref:Phthiocerol/phthiodiolone dimycocerosyl transferase C-terminal domain-containing protein n=2 Tax=Cucumis melo TaxID=3656 RepID=A0A5A7TKZ2_CUCMM|nr:uncharacterized protein E6C27_scaffold236G002060 [Cucumis melo var. makuwa]TYK25266.1 uncharacterized protein E5676_scaffold352G003990 [Cucumis melo var. makuwa]